MVEYIKPSASTMGENARCAATVRLSVEVDDTEIKERGEAFH
ncbi:hypothetical protein [Paramicrobacterium fandaimingii]|nr:hypothetical protein [Microbacterium fandaimingii]